MSGRPAATLRAAATNPALACWGLAASVYFLAVFHRSSLGVAGLMAEQRFGIGAAELSIFVMLQVGVYAAMQIPAGLLVDRHGPRRVLVVAGSLLGVAQLLFAVVPSYPLALGARAVLGLGDALTFVSVLRLVAGHFSPRRFSLLIGITTVVGVAGNLAATLPLAALLQQLGWTAGFAVAGGASLLCTAVVWLFLDEGHEIRSLREGSARVTLFPPGRRVLLVWAHPGTRLGFWAHFSCMSTAAGLVLLWGHPYLMLVGGFSSAGAGTILFIGVLVSGAATPLMGWVFGRRPDARVPIVLVLCVATISAWLVLSLAFGDAPPGALVAPVFVATVLGLPAAMAGSSIVRDAIAPSLLGTAAGVVNIGGYLAAMVAAVASGGLIALLGGTGPHALRLAMLVPLAIQAAGLARCLVWSRRAAGDPARRRPHPSSCRS